jgi:hypothetical protein
MSETNSEMREQFASGTPYAIRYEGQSRTSLFDNVGRLVATFTYESDAQTVADFLNELPAPEVHRA